MPASPNAAPAQFHQQLVATFSLDEIKQLCFDLNIEYEELGAETHSAKARGLIVFCAGHHLLQGLFDCVRSQRSNIEWVTTFESTDVPAWADAPKRAYDASHRMRHQLRQKLGGSA